jgi:hypothetical protein
MQVQILIPIPDKKAGHVDCVFGTSLPLVRRFSRATAQLYSSGDMLGSRQERKIAVSDGHGKCRHKQT